MYYTGNGIACVDSLRWDVFYWGKDLKRQVEAYKERHGVYPEKIFTPLYGMWENRGCPYGAEYSLCWQAIGTTEKTAAWRLPAMHSDWKQIWLGQEWLWLESHHGKTCPNLTSLDL